MDLSILAFAFVAGTVASVNPCGFAVLPAFASFVIGETGEDADSTPPGLRLWRAVRLGGMVTAAFIVVFAATGLVFTYVSTQIVNVVPWLALAVGVVLAVYGTLVFAGRGRFRVHLPNPAEGRSESRSGFLFGVGYAIASLSCTLPVFMAVIAGTLATSGLLAGTAGFVAYGAGMGTIVFAVAISMALARDGLVRRLRQAGRHVERIAGAVLAAAGGYLVLYWAYGLGPGRRPTLGSEAPAPVRAVTGLAETAARYLDSPAGRTAVVVLATTVVAAIVIAVVARRRQADAATADTDGPPPAPPHQSSDHTSDQEPNQWSPGEPAPMQPARPADG